MTSDVIAMKYYVYILQSSVDKKLYIGFTTDLKSRLRAHASGGVRSTRNRRYMKLVHYEYFIYELDAKARERYLKSGYGHEQIKSFLKRTLMDSSGTLNERL
jgi:putative endonuclease